MTTEQVWPVAAGAVALVALLCAAVSWRAARRAEAQVAALSTRLAVHEAASTDSPATVPSRSPSDAPSYVITGLDTDPAPGRSDVAEHAPAAGIDGRLFTDIVARETAVKAASWGHGLRRALSAESRNRIRFQVRQQAKQARRDRRAEAKEALREYRARQRADEGDAA